MVSDIQAFNFDGSCSGATRYIALNVTFTSKTMICRFEFSVLAFSFMGA